MVCFSCGKSCHAATRCPNLDQSFPFMQPGWRAVKTPWGFHYDPTPGDARPTEDGKRRLIRGEGFGSRVSGTVRPLEPGGGATPVAAAQRIRTDDVSDTAELSRGGGGPPLVRSRISVVLIYSALSDCLIVLCTVGFSSRWTSCSLVVLCFVLLAGFVSSGLTTLGLWQRTVRRWQK